MDAKPVVEGDRVAGVAEGVGQPDKDNLSFASAVNEDDPELVNGGVTEAAPTVASSSSISPSASPRSSISEISGNSSRGSLIMQTLASLPFSFFSSVSEGGRATAQDEEAADNPVSGLVGKLVDNGEVIGVSVERLVQDHAEVGLKAFGTGCGRKGYGVFCCMMPGARTDHRAKTAEFMRNDRKHVSIRTSFTS